MRTEFQMALVNDADKVNLEKIRKSLKDTAHFNHENILKHIEDDFLTAKLIVEALKMPKTSDAYKLGAAFIADFRKQHEARAKEIDSTLLEGIE